MRINKIITSIIALLTIPMVLAEDYPADLTVFTNIFTGSNIFGVTGLITIIIAFLGIVTITRDVEKWKILIFPQMVLIWAMGLPLGGLGILAMLIGIVIFIIEILSTQVIGNVISGINTQVKRTTQSRIRSYTPNKPKYTPINRTGEKTVNDGLRYQINKIASGYKIPNSNSKYRKFISS